MPTPALIDADRLATLLKEDGNHVLVVDCRYSLTDSAAGVLAYRQGHIPGAVHADVSALMSQAAKANGLGGRHPLPEPQAFAANMAALGAGTDTLIVAYDANQAVFAARLWWMLRWIGHESVCVLDGGLQAWLDAGGTLSNETPQPQAGNLKVGANTQPTVSFEQVLANLDKPERVVIDARGADRFRGENETLDPLGGHIPNALNRPYPLNLDEAGKFKPQAQLKAEFQDLLGNTPASSIVHQCGSGVSACHNLLAMHVAGLDGSALYPGSWSEWCRQAGAPVARG